MRSIGGGSVSNNGWTNAEAARLLTHVEGFLRRKAKGLDSEHQELRDEVVAAVLERPRNAVDDPERYAEAVAKNKVADTATRHRLQNPDHRRSSDLLHEVRDNCLRDFRLLTGRTWESVEGAVRSYAGLPVQTYKAGNRGWNERADIVRAIRREIDRAIAFHATEGNNGDPWFDRLVRMNLRPLVRELPPVRLKRFKRLLPPAGALANDALKFFGTKREADGEELLFRHFGRKGRIRVDGVEVELFRHDGRPTDREMGIVAILLDMGHAPKPEHNAKGYVREQVKRLARARERFFKRKGLPARTKKTGK
jgi:hypothetical protein